MKEITLKIYKERIHKALVFIQEHLDEEMELETLARVAHFSPFHFHRIFRGMTGESVKEHVRRLRLERAAFHLIHYKWTVIRIALSAGFDSHEAFTRAFRAMFGDSPSRFRSKRGRIPYVEAPSGVHYRVNGNLKNFMTVNKEAKKMNVEIKTIKPMRVAFMRHIGPYKECGKVWEKFCAWAGARLLLCPNTAFLGISHDDPTITPPEKLRYDACIPVDEKVLPDGEVGIQEIPGGEYAVIRHLGQYEKLIDTYAKIMGEWLPRSGREPRSTPCFEVYINSPDNTDPKDLITDIYIPLESK